mgnify:CR=1 FL=1
MFLVLLKTCVMGNGREDFLKLKSIQTTDFGNPEIWLVGDEYMIWSISLG